MAFIGRGLDILKHLFPVGSIYITTAATCPLATLISGSTWQNVGSSIITNVTIPSTIAVYGNGKALGLTDGSTNYGVANGYEQTANYGGLGVTTNSYNQNAGYDVGSNAFYINNTNYKAFGLSKDTSGKSGVVAKSSSITKTSLTVNIFKRTA